MNCKSLIIFFIILFIAAFFRFYGINWDQNQHLHPDERFLTMVAGSMKWPNTLQEYFDTSKSTLNPHNIGYGFYVYGTYPVIFVKWVSGVLGLDNYNGLVLVGRATSAIMDTAIVFITGAIAWVIFKNKRVAFLASLFYCLSVLPIQLAHFFA